MAANTNTNMNAKCKYLSLPQGTSRALCTTIFAPHTLRAKEEWLRLTPKLLSLMRTLDGLPNKAGDISDYQSSMIACKRFETEAAVSFTPCVLPLSKVPTLLMQMPLSPRPFKQNHASVRHRTTTL